MGKPHTRTHAHRNRVGGSQSAPNSLTSLATLPILLCLLPVFTGMVSEDNQQINMQLFRHAHIQTLLRTQQWGLVPLSPQIVVLLFIFSHQLSPLSPWIIHLPLPLPFPPKVTKLCRNTLSPHPHPGSEQWDVKTLGRSPHPYHSPPS